MMNIDFVNTDKDEYVSLDFCKVNNKFYFSISAYHTGKDGHSHETGDGIMIRVDLLKNLVDILSDIATILPKEMTKQSNAKMAASA